MQNTKGRPRIEVTKNSFAKQAQDFFSRKVTAEQAAAALGISRSTFFRRLKTEQTETKAG